MIGRTVTVIDPWTGIRQQRVTVHVEIDEIAIIDEIAARAASNRTGRSTALGGHITARVIVRSKEITS